MIVLGFFGLALVLLSVVCCLVIALSIAVVEISQAVDNRRLRRVVNARLAADREVADLDAIPVPGRWETSF